MIARGLLGLLYAIIDPNPRALHRGMHLITPALADFGVSWGVPSYHSILCRSVIFSSNTIKNICNYNNNFYLLNTHKSILCLVCEQIHFSLIGYIDIPTSKTRSLVLIHSFQHNLPNL